MAYINYWCSNINENCGLKLSNWKHSHNLVAMLGQNRFIKLFTQKVYQTTGWFFFSSHSIHSFLVHFSLVWMQMQPLLLLLLLVTLLLSAHSTFLSRNKFWSQLKLIRKFIFEPFPRYLHAYHMWRVYKFIFFICFGDVVFDVRVCFSSGHQESTSHFVFTASEYLKWYPFRKYLHIECNFDHLCISLCREKSKKESTYKLDSIDRISMNKYAFSRNSINPSN